jgi:cytoskeletal protein CcmA (bactofilin family)
MFEKKKEAAEVSPEPRKSEAESRVFKNDTSSRVTATIGETICIEGDVTGTESLIVNGTVKGSVNLANNDLTIGQTGKVTADLCGKSVKVDGNVTGDITGTEGVVVSKNGQVRGNITAPRVTLEDGANFKGSIDMDPVGGHEKFSPKAEKPQAKPEPELRTAEGGRI